jgi:hypothetical protein
VRGTISILNNKNLTGFRITQERTVPDGNGGTMTVNDSQKTCEVDDSNNIFSCVTADLLGYDDWTIKLDLDTNGYVCNATDDVITLTDASVPDFTFEYEDINTLQITIAGSAAGCP